MTVQHLSHFGVEGAWSKETNQAQFWFPHPEINPRTDGIWQQNRKKLKTDLSGFVYDPYVWLVDDADIVPAIVADSDFGIADPLFDYPLAVISGGLSRSFPAKAEQADRSMEYGVEARVRTMVQSMLRVCEYKIAEIYLKPSAPTA